MERFVEVYGSIGLLAGVAQCVYLGVAFWLGVRLVNLARRTRELPELLLGLHLILTLGVAYILLSAGISVAELSRSIQNLVLPDERARSDAASSSSSPRSIWPPSSK